MTQYKALMVDTILKELRSKTLIFIFIISTIAIIFGQMILSFVIANLGSEDALAISGSSTLSLTFRIINSVSFLVAAILGVSVFKSDFKNNIIYQYLTFPISRTEYFFIRVLGTWVLALSYYLYTYALSAILYTFTFKNFILEWSHLGGFLVLSFYLLLVIFMSIFFSLFMNKIGALLSISVVSSISAIAYNSYAQVPFKELFQEFSSMKIIGLIVYFLYPRMSFLDNLATGFLLKEAMTVNVMAQFIHLIAIAIVYIFIANLIIKKKDF